MINEYLFLDDKHREEISTYSPDNISVDVSDVDNTILWIVTFTVQNKNEESALMLSDVHTFMSQYSPMVLTCESSEYYNKILFPSINELERKLRKLLYLAVSISDDEASKSTIKNLEEKDFGIIFDMLFTDPNFISKLKERVNATAKSVFEGKGKYSKNEIQTFLDNTDEDTLWDQILDSEKVPTLKKRFRDVQAYRNEVMHAHNTNREVFEKARYLFSSINSELDKAIEEILNHTKDDPETPKGGVNRSVSNALIAMDLADISDSLHNMTKMSEFTSQIAPIFKDIYKPLITPSIEAVIKSISSMQNNNGVSEAFASLKSMQMNSAIENMRQQIANMADVLRPYNYSSERLQEAITAYGEIQNSISSISNQYSTGADVTDDTVNEDEENINGEA